MTPHERWQAATDHVSELLKQTRAATPAPWRPMAMGSEGYTVFGPQGTRRGGHPRATPRTALCTYEDWDTDKANALLIAALRNASGGLLTTALTVLAVHRPAAPAETPWSSECAGCPRDDRWPCSFVEPLLNTFGIRP